MVASPFQRSTVNLNHCARFVSNRLSLKFKKLRPPPPSMGGLDLNSSNREVAVLIGLVRRHRRAVGAAVHRAAYDEVSGRRRAKPRCAVCLQAFWVRCLYMPLVRLALPLLHPRKRRNTERGPEAGVRGASPEVV